MRTLLLVALLLGPLAVAELWARQQPRLLYPYLHPESLWSEAKLLLIERSGCPDVLGLGSSVTNRILVREAAVGHPLAAGRVESVFAFGLRGSRLSIGYAVWRQIQARGCTPELLLVELLPGLLRSAQADPALLAPLLDAPTQWRLPAGFAAEQGLGARTRWRMATWDRLLLHRRRAQWRAAIPEALGLRPFSGVEAPLPPDGVIHRENARGLDADRSARERTSRERAAAAGHYDFRLSPVETAALRQLVREGRAAGARVVLHTPPASAIYREILAQRDPDRGFCALRRQLDSQPGFEWHSAYAAPGYPDAAFSDWIHLTREAGDRYAAALFAALAGGPPLADDGCGID